MYYKYNTAEGYSYIKKSKMTSSAGKQLELEITVLVEISQTQKDEMPHFLSHTEIRLKKKDYLREGRERGVSKGGY